MPLNEKDLKNIARTVDNVTSPQFQELSTRLKNVEKNTGQLTTTVDNFAHIVRRHEEEWLVLRAQHEKTRDVLVKKGIVSEEDLAIA